MVLFILGFLTGFIVTMVAVIAIGRRVRRQKTARRPTPAEAHRAVEQGIASAKWTSANWPWDRPWPEA
jgi:hypothetical protein